MIEISPLAWLILAFYGAVALFVAGAAWRHGRRYALLMALFWLPVSVAVTLMELGVLPGAEGRREW